MHNQFDNNTDMPVGLKMALTQNLNALNQFAALSPAEQFSFIRKAQKIGSQQEMQAYVNRLSQG